MRMIGPAINAQISELPPPERPARKHPLHGLLDHALGKPAFQDRLRRLLLDAADEAGVAVLDLLLALAAG